MRSGKVLSISVPPSLWADLREKGTRTALKYGVKSEADVDRIIHEVRRRAKATGKSLNKVVLELIGGSTGSEKRRKKPAGASLAALAGGWSEKEAREFEESVRVFEEIDEGMWK